MNYTLIALVLIIIFAVSLCVLCAKVILDSKPGPSSGEDDFDRNP